MNSPPIIMIVGPTGVGKSAVALRLARELNGEIVSCDAMQVYREIAVASAKPSAQELRQVPHHLIDVVSVTEDFDVARFRRLAVRAIDDIRGRGKIPVVTGGSGMYMTILLDGIFEGGGTQTEIRERLKEDIAREGLAALYDRLQIADPAAAAKIHKNDERRIVRALEVLAVKKAPISQLQQERQGLWGQAPVHIFALTRERKELYRRVEERVEAMFAHGLIEEIRRVIPMPLSHTARSLIGIPEIAGYLEGAYDLKEAKALLKLHTRRYVKRQLTWFRRDKRLQWITLEGNEDSAVREILMKVKPQ